MAKRAWEWCFSCTGETVSHPHGPGIFVASQRRIGCAWSALRFNSVFNACHSNCSVSSNAMRYVCGFIVCEFEIESSRRVLGPVGDEPAVVSADHAAD
jgi:hypothetical protein